MKVVLRARKVKLTNLNTMHRHNYRAVFTEANTNIDKSRDIVHLVGSTETAAEIRTRIKTSASRKPRKDTVGAIEFIISASPEYFFKDLDKDKYDTLTVKKDAEEIKKVWDTLDHDRLKKFNQKALEWAQNEFGDNVVNAVLHLDEKSPHIHLTVIPMVDGKLNAKAFWRNPGISRKWQDSIGEAMQPLGLERGEQNSKAIHQPHQQHNAIVEAERAQEVKHKSIPKSYHLDIGSVRIGIGEKEREESLKQGYKKYKKYYRDNHMKHTKDMQHIATLEKENQQLKQENQKLKKDQETMRKRISDTELNNLRDIDVISVASSYLGTEAKQETADQARLKTANHNIVIKPDNLWYDNKSGKGGKGAVSLLCDCFGFDFKEAVEYLRNHSGSKPERIVKALQQHSPAAVAELATDALEQHFASIPQPSNRHTQRVFDYLTNTRKISPQLVTQLTDAGLLYADGYANCVFTNPSKTSAVLRGTSPTKRFVANRGPADVFTYQNSDDATLFVFESPIDLLSYLTVNPEAKGTFISLNGNSTIGKVATVSYLRKYNQVICCTDNDNQGAVFLNKLKQQHNNVVDGRPQGCKDWNEYLNSPKQNNQQPKPHNRLKPGITW